ncbi:MAG: VOC family protein [Bacteroidota bacterium]
MKIKIPTGGGRFPRPCPFLRSKICTIVYTDKLGNSGGTVKIGSIRFLHLRPLVWLFFIAIALSSATSCKSVKEINAKASMEEGAYFKRMNILVSDMERSLKIYEDILGFTANSISTSGEDSYSYPVFKIPKEAKMRFMTLDSPSQERTLALTEVTGIELTKPQPPYRSAAVVKSDDIDGMMQQIQALGLETTEPKIAGGAAFRFKEQAFVDYDGNLIVLYQILK